MDFYRCERCGNIAVFMTGMRNTPVCCGQQMTKLEANATDAAQEKHVPQVTVEGNSVTVKIGAAPHPMTKEHHIEFLVLETSRGFQKADLTPGDAPEAVFAIARGEKPVTAYAWCNLHGLWKADI